MKEKFYGIGSVGRLNIGGYGNERVSVAGIEATDFIGAFPDIRCIERLRINWCRIRVERIGRRRPKGDDPFPADYTPCFRE